MGELVMIQQPGRVSRAPLWRLSGFGKLPGVPTGGTRVDAGPAGPPPPSTTATPRSRSPLSVIDEGLRSINSGGAASFDPPVRMTATGEALPTKSATTIVRMFPQQFNPSAFGPWPTPQPAPPIVLAPPAVTPAPPMPGGGGGGGGAAADDSPPLTDPPVFLGLTQKQLLIGGALAVGAWFLLRKKKGGAPAADLGGGL